MNSSTDVANDTVVSSDAEMLILVDADDVEIGQQTKAVCHDGAGLLHRAFSLFVFNTAGEVLLQQRSRTKRLWPGYWANTCCSHPRHNETMQTATQRRLQQELGFTCDLEYVYKFTYHATYQQHGSERELCWVYVGVSDLPVRPNPHEIEDWRFMPPDELDTALANDPEQFTPWLQMEWARLRGEFADRLPIPRS